MIPVIKLSIWNYNEIYFVQHGLTIIREFFSLITAFFVNFFECLLRNVTIITVKLHQIWPIIILELTLSLVSASISDCKSFNIDLILYCSVLIIIMKPFFNENFTFRTKLEHKCLHNFHQQNKFSDLCIRSIHWKIIKQHLDLRLQQLHHSKHIRQVCYQCMRIRLMKEIRYKQHWLFYSMRIYCS